MSESLILDLHKIGEDLISLNNLVFHLSMECSKRIKGISENLINLIQSIAPSDDSRLLNDEYLTEAERNEFHALNTTLTCTALNLIGVQRRRDEIIRIAMERGKAAEEEAGQ